jgi:hypothetical protein
MRYMAAADSVDPVHGIQSRHLRQQHPRLVQDQPQHQQQTDVPDQRRGVRFWRSVFGEAAPDQRGGDHKKDLVVADVIPLGGIVCAGEREEDDAGGRHHRTLHPRERKRGLRPVQPDDRHQVQQVEPRRDVRQNEE